MTQWKIDDELIAQDGNNNEYGGSPYKHFVRSLGKKLFDEIEADSYENGEEMYDAKLKNPIRIVVTKDEDEHRYIIKTVYAAFKLKCTEEYILWVVADYTWVRNGLEFVHLNQGRFVASTARHPDSSVYCENTNDLKEYYNGYMETTDWSMISTYHGSIDGKMTYRVYSPEYQSDLLMLVRGRNKSDKFINIRPIFGNGLAYDPAEPEQIKNNTR